MTFEHCRSYLSRTLGTPLGTSRTCGSLMSILNPVLEATFQACLNPVKNYWNHFSHPWTTEPFHRNKERKKKRRTDKRKKKTGIVLLPILRCLLSILGAVKTPNSVPSTWRCHPPAAPRPSGPPRCTELRPAPSWPRCVPSSPRP